jgi:uncharacterized protein (TIRG00374 family)
VKSILRYLVFLAIGAGLFWLASGTVEDPDALWSDMRKVSWEGIAGSVLLGYAAIVSRGLRWQLLLRPIGIVVPPARGVHAVAFGYFANTFVPRSGELARCAALNQTDGAAVDKLFGTVLSERVIDFVMLFLFTGIAVIFNFQAFREFSASFAVPEFSIWMVGLAAAITIAALYTFWTQRQRLAAWPPIAKVVAFLSGIRDGLLSIRKMERKWAFVGHTIFIWSMYFWMAMVIFWSIDDLASMPPWQALFIVVAGGFGMVIPAPGGIGSYHYAVQLAFIALGYSGQLGLATANVVWATQTGMIVLSGGLGYLALMSAGLRKKPGLRKSPDAQKKQAP